LNIALSCIFYFGLRVFSDHDCVCVTPPHQIQYGAEEQ
jgi:hypothetical protein